MDINLRDEYRHIGLFYDDVAAVLTHPDDLLFQARDTVSAWSPAQQLYHILRSNGMMCKAIQLICHSHPQTRNEGAPNAIGRALLAHGFVRGRGQAPDAVVPPDTLTREDLQEAMARSFRKYAETEAFLPEIPTATGRLPHHVLGMFNASEWIRLMRLHSEHHLAIIQDILGHQEAA